MEALKRYGMSLGLSQDAVEPVLLDGHSHGDAGWVDPVAAPGGRAPAELAKQILQPGVRTEYLEYQCRDWRGRPRGARVSS